MTWTRLDQVGSIFSFSRTTSCMSPLPLWSGAGAGQVDDGSSAGVQKGGWSLAGLCGDHICHGRPAEMKTGICCDITSWFSHLISHLPS